MDIKLLLASEIHEHTDAEKNVWAATFDPRIIRCQIKHVEPLLGEQLLELLGEALQVERAAVAARAAALAAAPETPADELPALAPMPAHLAALRTALAPMLAQWIWYMSLPFMLLKATNAGLEQKSLIDDKAYGTYARGVRDEAEARTEDFKKWLAAHAGDYPELKQPLQPKQRRATGGIVL